MEANSIERGLRRGRVYPHKEARATPITPPVKLGFGHWLETPPSDRAELGVFSELPSAMRGEHVVNNLSVIALVSTFRS